MTSSLLLRHSLVTVFLSPVNVVTSSCPCKSFLSCIIVTFNSFLQFSSSVSSVISFSSLNSFVSFIVELKITSFYFRKYAVSLIKSIPFCFYECFLSHVLIMIFFLYFLFNPHVLRSVFLRL